VACDGRLFHRRAAVTGNALSPTVDRRVRRTSRDVDDAERSRRLDSVSAGRRSFLTQARWRQTIDILYSEIATDQPILFLSCPKQLIKSSRTTIKLPTFRTVCRLRSYRDNSHSFKCKFKLHFSLCFTVWLCNDFQVWFHAWRAHNRHLLTYGTKY